MFPLLRDSLYQQLQQDTLVEKEKACDTEYRDNGRKINDNKIITVTYKDI